MWNWIKALVRMFCGHGTMLERLASLQAEHNALVVATTPPLPPLADQFDRLDYDEVYKLLVDTFPDYKNKIFISDRQFVITSIDQIRRFVDWDKIDQIKYTSQFLDCDDFALALAGAFAKYPGWSGFPVTYIWGNYGPGPHAFVIVVAWPTQDERVPRLYYIEPQNDWEILPETIEGMELMLLPM